VYKYNNIFPPLDKLPPYFILDPLPKFSLFSSQPQLSPVTTMQLIPAIKLNLVIKKKGMKKKAISINMSATS
jgi:hypothetical protein